MKTLLEYITFVKGVEYLIIIAFCFGFVSLWLLVHTRERKAMKKIVSVVIPVSLIFGGAAAILATHDSSYVNITAAPNVSEPASPEYYSNGTPATITANSQDKWLGVNSSEYLTISYGPATKFHQVMSTKVSCQTCHHNGKGEIRACKDCHNNPFNPKNSTIPGLKAAYHQLCMSCHKEDFKGGPESCIKCHTGERATSKAVSAPDRPHSLTWETCSNCHKDGIPGGQTANIVYHDNCLKCHTKGMAGAKNIPADHAGREINTCQGCHKPAGGIT